MTDKRLIGAVFLIFLAVATVFCQEKTTDPDCDHTSAFEDRFEKMRITQPVKVIDFDGLTITYLEEKKFQLTPKTFKVEKDTHLDRDFIKNWKNGRWWLVYCSAERHLYFAEKFDRQRLKTK